MLGQLSSSLPTDFRHNKATLPSDGREASAVLACVGQAMLARNVRCCV